MIRTTLLGAATAGALLLGLSTQTPDANAARVHLYVGVPGVSLHLGGVKTYHCHTNWVKVKGTKKKKKVTYCHTAYD